VAVVVVVEVEVVLAAELPPLEDECVVLGTITVTVTRGVVFVILVPDLVVTVVPDLGLLGAVPGDGVLVGVVLPGWNAAYCTVWAGAE
jgi:hypothetical protein